MKKRKLPERVWLPTHADYFFHDIMERTGRERRRSHIVRGALIIAGLVLLRWWF
jgi:hypothetical protein